MPKLIGYINSESEAIKSTYADNEIMFGHTNIKQDFERNPSWVSFVPHVTANPFGILFGNYKMLDSYKTKVHPSVGSSRCPFGY